MPKTLLLTVVFDSITNFCKTLAASLLVGSYSVVSCQDWNFVITNVPTLADVTCILPLSEGPFQGAGWAGLKYV